VRQGIEAQLRNPLHKYHSRVRQVNYDDCYFFDPITLEELDKVRTLPRTAFPDLYNDVSGACVCCRFDPITLDELDKVCTLVFVC
jgi:hypothetical protein